MVGKLLKYEILSIYKIIIIIHAVMFSVAIGTGIIYLIEIDNELYSLLKESLLLTFYNSVSVCTILTEIFIAVKFYVSLFKKEGYLTHTLPITPSQLITSKLISGSLVSLLTITTSIIACCIANPEAPIVIYEKFTLNFYKPVYQMDIIFIILEIISAIIIVVICNYSLVFACISIGQRVRRCKILLSVGIYMAYTYLLQLIFWITFFVCIILDLFEPIINFVKSLGIGAVHLLLLLIILLSLIQAVIFNLLTYNSIDKHLNLE